MALTGSTAVFSKSTNSIWIFGYGSLVHTPGFEVRRRVKGYVRDWKRVWHQGSTDHRGTPDFPGRTVTLEYYPGAITWGVAYELAGTQAQQAKTLKYLEWREKQYDIRERMCVYGALDQLEVLQSQGPPLDQPLSDPVDSIPENHRSFLEGLEAHTEPLAGVEEGWKPQLGPQGRGAEHEQQPGASVSGRPATFSASASSEGVAGSGQGGLPPQDDTHTFSVEVHTLDGASETKVTRQRDRVGAEPEQESISFRADGDSGYVLLLEDVLCYIASSNKSNNANYLGPATPDELALQIAQAVGPSGPNWEYVARLADAMRSMEVHDPELFALEKQVAQAMVSLRRQQQQATSNTSSKFGELGDEVKMRQQILKEREAKFLAFHLENREQ